jgi:hypothetical protein
MKKLILLFSLPFIFISCQPPGGPPIEPPEVDPGEVVQQDSHLGTWETACQVENQNTTATNDDVQFKHRMVISEGFVDLKVTVFPNGSNCNQAVALGEFSYKLQYSRTADNYSTTVKEYNYKPISSSYANYISSNIPSFGLPFCGLAWQQNISQSLFGKDCLIGGQILKRDLNAPGAYSAVRSDNVLAADIDGENLSYNLVQ